MAGRVWPLALAAAVGLAVMSLASNITTVSQLSGEADTLLTVRFTISKLVNAGPVWAGLGVLSGWLVRRPVQAMAAGIVACVLALGAHYGLGTILGMFDAEAWSENSYWFVAAVVLGGPLGLVGTIARRADSWGLAARLLVPVAVAIEPFATGMFNSPAILPRPDRVSSLASGMILLVGGTMGVVAVLAAAKKEQSVG